MKKWFSYSIDSVEKVSLPEETHAHVAFGGVPAETKPILAIQVCQDKGEVFFCFTEEGGGGGEGGGEIEEN